MRHLVDSVIIYLLAILDFVTFSSATDGLYPICCESVSGSCRTACHKITLIDLATKPERHKLFTAHLEHHCGNSRHLGCVFQEEFMRCFNNTTRELQRGSNWHGRECCVFAKDNRCRVACIHAQSLYELEPVCWPNKESGLYDCVRLRADASNCCNSVSSRNRSTTCRNYCTDLLPAATERPLFTYGDLMLLHPECTESLETVHCVWGLGIPPEYPLECHGCCNASTNSYCKSACNEVVRAKMAGVAAIEHLVVSGCGSPEPQEPFWICLSKSLNAEKSPVFVSSKVHTNPDAMKVHCCLKATSARCRHSCFQAYGPNSVINDAEEFLLLCMDAFDESRLRICLRDVSMPCQLGCSNLNFCSHFNQRTTAPFRSCDASSDREAQLTYDKWKKEGQIVLDRTTPIKIRVDYRCNRVWRGFLCALHIKPCHPRSWSNSLCFSDCKTLVSSCLVPSWESTAEALCNYFLSSEEPQNGTCTPIEIPDQRSGVVHLIFDQLERTPCQPNPCPANMRCEVHRYNERYTNTTYVCIPGCAVSTSGFAFVMAKDDVMVLPSFQEENICYATCTCTSDGMLTNCVDLTPCEKFVGCWANMLHYDHGTTFQRACSRCICLAGEIICSAGYCLTEAQRDEERNALTGLPCSCPTDFNRVCGSNGKTYPTECSARCSGLSEYHFTGGICSVEHICPQTDCGKDQWCLERSEVCLDHLVPCHQHTCVDIKTVCAEQTTDIACDQDAVEHQNLCFLLLDGKRFAYMGRCLDGCLSSGTVCGHNSETFASECTALASRVGIDYLGKCITVGGKIERGLLNTCLVVMKLCQPKANENCVGLVPPDACCPVCAGGLRILFSRTRIKRLADKGVVSVTTRRVMTELQKLVTSSTCEVLGYLTMENDIVVLVKKLNITSAIFSEEELTVCVVEAERLHYLIETQHPLITTNAYLWPLASSKVIHNQLRSASESVFLYNFAQYFLSQIAVFIVTVLYIS